MSLYYEPYNETVENMVGESEPENMRLYKYNSALKEFINKIDVPLIWKEVLSFFGMNHFDFVSSLLLFLTNIKTCDEHHTVEYRMLTPTFNYSRIVAEMLIAVQINKAMLKGLPINEKIVRSIINAFNNSKVEIKA